LDTIARPEQSFQYKVFRIENLELLNMLGLPRREGFRYALAEFGSKLPELGEHAEKARQLDAAQLTILQRKILELERKIGLVDLLVKSFSPPDIRPESARDDLFRAIRQQQALESRHPPLVVPPAEADGQWQTFSAAWTRGFIQRHMTNETPPPATEAWTKMVVAYSKDDVSEFNTEVAAYQKLLAEAPPENVNLRKTDFEAYFNHVEPFYHALVLYVGAFVLTALSWLGWRRPLNSAAFWLIAVTLVVHSLALVARIYISGRPPVTNLYSSAVFIGWGAVVLGIVLEAVYRIGIGNVIASVAGFATLLIAHVLAGDGDTFTVLQAVLDTQFWLATHVVCITLGYATTFVAGLLGVLYIIRGVVTPSLTPAVGKDLARMIYGTVCFAIFFSFVGTVLGGLWADDSWGRFWGWDPKENGALIIVLWNALVLHARWGGLVKDRGLAVLAVGGNIVTSWSWFGVNELGVGLHSYGFTEGVLLSLGLFVLTQAAIIGLGCLPKNLWWSSRAA
jgi:ABC-type transport system involved in cytochrome c biogenesis permease subunit